MNKEAFFKITYGLYVISSKWENTLNGFVSNTVFQVTSEPAQIAVGCHKENFTTGLIEKSRAFSISVMKQDYKPHIMQLFGYNSGRELDKYRGVKYKMGSSGAPIMLEDTLAWFDCRLVQTVDTGSHMLFIGNVLDNAIIDDKAMPLTYEHFHNIKKAFAPKNSPTYIQPQLLNITTAEDKGGNFICRTCGYVYIPANGDEAGKIPPGTRFEELPEEWVCPICGASKKKFSHISN